MKLIKTEDAVGHVLCHDLTRIVKDEFKGAQFKKRTHYNGRGYSYAFVYGKRAFICMGNGRRHGP